MNQIDIMLEPVRAVLLQFGAFLPRLLLALVILLIGWVLAKAIRLLVVKGLRAVNLNVLTERAGIDRLPREDNGKIYKRRLRDQYRQNA